MVEPPELRLYLVADLARREPAALVSLVERAVAGGATAVQLRAKGHGRDAGEIRELAGRLRQLCHAAGVLFFVDDDIELAGRSGADGVHLGPHDAPAREARAQLGSCALVGVSAGSAAAVRTMLARGRADYIGCGNLFGTATKADASAPIGLEGLREVVAATPLPVVGIGGVDASRAREVVASGAAGVAVASAILDAADPGEAARALREAADAGWADSGR